MIPSRILLPPALVLAGLATFFFGSEEETADALIRVDRSETGRGQLIHGFGTCISGEVPREAWFRRLFFEDLRATILRIDITPHFHSPVSDHLYNSPWFGNDPELPGPEGNRVRSYTGPADYGREFAGRRTPIAIMGPDIDRNAARFDFEGHGGLARGEMAREGRARREALGGFRLLGSLWSPAPWLKVASGNVYPPHENPVLPTPGTPFPFVWNGNFAGGRLDVSGRPLAVFDDRSAGGRGPTSALTQFARSVAAYLRGFQRRFGVRFDAVSIQNEPAFEQFYNSAIYLRAEDYARALRAVRDELDRYPDLRTIRLFGPEDLLGNDAYGLWEYGERDDVLHKNLQLVAGAQAGEDGGLLDVLAVHGYAPDGSSAAAGEPRQWERWAHGWSASPAPGLPDGVRGALSYAAPSYVTETSGEAPVWLAPRPEVAFPGEGAFGLAVRIHQALTAGRQSAFVYWQLADGRPAWEESLTDGEALDEAPKLVAMRHYARFVRPRFRRFEVEVRGARELLVSAYRAPDEERWVMVLVHRGSRARRARIELPLQVRAAQGLELFVSSEGSLFERTSPRLEDGELLVRLPPFSVATLEIRPEDGAPRTREP